MTNALNYHNIHEQALRNRIEVLEGERKAILFALRSWEIESFNDKVLIDAVLEMFDGHMP